MTPAPFRFRCTACSPAALLEGGVWSAQRKRAGDPGQWLHFDSGCFRAAEKDSSPTATRRALIQCPEGFSFGRLHTQLLAPLIQWLLPVLLPALQHERVRSQADAPAYGDSSADQFKLLRLNRKARKPARVFSNTSAGKPIWVAVMASTPDSPAASVLNPAIK